MALLCAGSLLVARGVSGAIHECLKGANVPAERVQPFKKKEILCPLLSTSNSSAFAKLLKETTSFFMCVCPSVRVEELGFYWKDFHEI